MSVTASDVAPFIGAHGLFLALLLFANVVRGWLGVR